MTTEIDCVAGRPEGPILRNNSSRPSLWLPLALVLGIGAAYWNSFTVPFFFDDHAAILENHTIRDLTNIAAVLSPPANGSGVTGRPVVNLSLAINHAIAGTDVRGYHVTNLLFHCGACLALFGTVRRTLCLPRFAATHGPVSAGLAFAIAGIWAVHPLQTESVTCVVQRTELLVGLFLLLTFYCVTRYVEGRSRMWAALAVASCAAGMASKEVMAVAPLLILAYDRTFVSGSWAAAWKRHGAMHVSVAACWLVLGVLVLRMGGTRGDAAGFGVGIAWWEYALKQCEAIIHYLRLTIWPHPLVVFYGTDVVSHPLDVWPQILALSVGVTVTLIAFHRGAAVGFVGVWFFVTLAPSSSVVPLVSQTMSEHRMYLSLASPVILAVLGLSRWRPRRWIPIGVAASLAFAIVAARRNLDYRSTLAIWNDTVAKVPKNARARTNLAAVLKDAKQWDAALAHLEIALKLEPAQAEAWNNVGAIMIEKERPADAIAPCETALRLKPKFALAHNNLGSALMQTGRVADGIRHLRTAIGLRPEFPEAFCNLSSALVITGEIAEAVRCGEEAVRLRPAFELALFNLSTALIHAGEVPRAIKILETLVQVVPAHAEAHSNLGSLYFRTGQIRRAIPCFEEALRLRPDYTEARNNLGGALTQIGKPAEAVTHYRAVLATKPDFADAHFNLGLAWLRLGDGEEAKKAFEAALRLRPDDSQVKEALQRTTR